MPTLPHGEKFSFLDLPIETSLKSPPDQLADDILLTIEGAHDLHIRFDTSRVQRFAVEGDKGREASGWYIAHSGRVPVACYGNWRTGETHKWHADIGRDLTPEEVEQAREEARRSMELAEKQHREDAAKAAAECVAQWQGAQDAPADFPYLTRKGVGAYGLKVTPDGSCLMMAIQDVSGNIVSMQYISADGNKRLKYGAEKSGHFGLIQGEGEKTYIGEGYATCASIHEATGAEVIVAIDAQNMKKVAQTLKAAGEDGSKVVFVADNDDSHVGQRCAEEAASILNAGLVVIERLPETPKGTDANDYAQAKGKEELRKLLGAPRLPEEWIVSGAEYISDQAKIRYLVKGIVQVAAMQMIFGASGSGKTFFSLDLALHIACAQVKDWHGRVLRHGSVLYLNGEGAVGFKQRIRGWLKAHGLGADALNDFLVSKWPQDIDGPDGKMSISQIKSTLLRLGKVPVAVFIDTLNQHMSGDENKAQDTRAFLRAVSDLRYEYPDASVIIIHHTGVSEEAKGRARGSSAWRGAMDIEIKITEANGKSSLMQATMTKNKDGQLLRPLYFSKVETDTGLLDDDEQPITTITLQRYEPPAEDEDKSKLSESAFKCLSIFRRLARNEVSYDESGKFIGVPYAAWRDTCKSETCAGMSAEASRQEFKRNVDELKEARYVRIEGNTVNVKTKARIWFAGALAKQDIERYEMEFNASHNSA